MTTGSFLEMADRIGARICRDAIWNGDRCNWVAGYKPDPGQEELVYQALNPSLYRGTSGIALFLGRLFRATGENIFRATANAALRQALSRQDRLQAAGNFGLYSGLAGVACVLAEAGEPFFSRGKELVHALAPSLALKECDVIGGNAGILAAALHLHRMGGGGGCLDAAIRHGEILLDAARRSAAGWSWATIIASELPSRPDLTGFAHGAAGIAWSLLELWSATGERRYRAAAEEGFRYEQSCFSPEHGNWPDYRECSSESMEAQYPAWWCHGAGGIAFSRLRAAQLTGEAQYQEQARIALETVERTLSDPWGSCGICHGLFGSIDLLLYANTPERVVLAQNTAREASERYAARRLPWPCDAGGVETPDLMLGLAGIGHTFLRLEDPAAFPSPLILSGDQEIKNQKSKIKNQK